MNRPVLTAKNRGSGGVGIMLRDDICTQYETDCCFMDRDNVIGMLLTCRLMRESLMIYCVYLPPESSRFAGENESVFNNILIDVYQRTEVDTVLICGDFNARIGTKNNCQIFDDIAPRISLDNVSNSQGDKLLSFINDIKGCIINGRVSPELNDFTSVTGYKGKAVVDYFITRQNDLNAIVKFNVIGCTEIIAKYELEQLVSDVSRIPDHCMLCVEVEMSVGVRDKIVSDGVEQNIPNKRTKVYRKFGEEYMNSEVAERVIPELIEMLENKVKTQNEMNECYDHLINFLTQEAEYSLKSKGKKRKVTKYKEYWDNELSKSWRNMHEKDKMFRTAKNQRCVKELCR